MKLDPKVTKSIQSWLALPPADRDISAGASLLLSLNRNRALYNSIIKRPARMAAKLEYELKKILRIRLDNKTMTDVAQMDATVMPRAKAIVDSPPAISTDDELPAATVATGRRADHDSLPAEIRALWDDNGPIYQKIKILFSELKAMADAAPCDRYERLVILDELDKKYRANLAAYDAYVPGTPSLITADHSADDEKIITDNARTIGNARKTLSKYRKLIVYMEADDPRREEAAGKIRDAARAIIACGGGLAHETLDFLTAQDINLDDPFN